MHNSILVRNLGPLENVNLDLTSQFSTVIGAQASGKSTLAKIIYFCKKIRDYTIKFIGEDKVFFSGVTEDCYSAFLKNLLRKFMSTFDVAEFASENFYVKYNYDESSFVQLILDSEGFVKFSFSSNIENKLQTLFANVKKFNYETLPQVIDRWDNITIDNFWQLQAATLQKTNWVNDLFHDKADYIYIPAGRGILSILATKLVDLNNTNLGLPIKDFIRRVLVAKNRFKINLDKVVENYTKTTEKAINESDIKLAQDLIRTILKANYVNHAEGERLYIDSGHYINLIQGSSGQQESLWILLFMFSIILENKQTFIILEEPEANVYPNTQKEIIKLIALTLNSTNSQVFITTHSPYILTSANLLIHSGRVENNISNNNIVIPERFRIAPETTAAYKFEDDNTLKTIRDNDTGMINASEIDTVSDIIVAETEKLIDLELKYGL